MVASPAFISRMIPFSLVALLEPLADLLRNLLLGLGERGRGEGVGRVGVSAVGRSVDVDGRDGGVKVRGDRK